MMTTAAPLDILQSCRDDGILTDNEIAQASAHAQYGQLMPAVDHVGLLVWLVRHHILTEEELRQRGAVFSTNMLDSLKSTNSGGNVQVQTPIDVALSVLERWRVRPDFDALRHHGLITQEECVLALRHCEDDEVDHTPATTLAWMMINRFISEARETEILAREKTAPPDLAAILAQARDMVEVVRKRLESSASGGGIVLILLLLGIILAAAWMIVM